ncbi:MAG TPA: hypothetical protein VM938_14980 [Acidimicrobiales bacterium]|nr:hypothetical protein [Acidimicrobiales bacterium]
MTRRAVAVLIAAVFALGACSGDGSGTTPTSSVPSGADTGGKTPGGAGGGTTP